jgi:hypothetical protein
MAEEYVWDKCERLISFWTSKLGLEARNSLKIKRLNRILECAIEGTALSHDDFEFINDCTPGDPIVRCMYRKPLGQCGVGVMDFCRHVKDWEVGKRGCIKYEPEKIKKESF